MLCLKLKYILAFVIVEDPCEILRALPLCPVDEILVVHRQRLLLRAGQHRHDRIANGADIHGGAPTF